MDNKDKIILNSVSVGGNCYHPEDGYHISFYNEDDQGNEYDTVGVTVSEHAFNTLHDMIDIFLESRDAKISRPTLSLDRAKQLLLNMIEAHGKPFLSGDWLDISDTINYLFTLDFTEEEILELGFCTEEDIDRANEENMSND